ncbi:MULTISPECIES: glutathione S-transferase family protein [unclassified Sphingopyxis]|uniref:glutathione S-transferase family protein n=1 Tax=unclassified Sphingopyxis TaxID=2614943 RepID=UPI0006C36B68|nr:MULTISPECIES: glutathione S-transferase family protein [unclassified Sphingopyxis]USI76358.1 glutathione S-transferase family protein [Sphingopyxis sp. USTB-05]GAO76907.1 glutathione S-transferase family protein [Sphingopyxis sp. C-1]
MIIYGSVVSPFVRKLLGYLGEKRIEFELKGVGIGDPDPGFRAASPLGKMPAMDDDGFLLADSSAIIQYIEAKYPEPALIPTDPQERGRVIWWEEFGDTVFAACSGKMFFNRIVAPKFLGREGDLAAAAQAEGEELPKLLAYLESAIPASGFLVGDRLTLADIAAASPLMNFRHCGACIDAAVHPRIAAWSEAILSRPSMAPWIAKEEKLIARVLAA